MAKYVSVNEALALVKSGDYIVTGLGSAEGREFMTNLHTIAGNLFCNALEELEKSGKPLTRANLVEIMESVELQVAMADKISYANGARTGVESFSAAFFYDTADETIMGELATDNHAAASAPLSGLQTIDDLKKLITE